MCVCVCVCVYIYIYIYKIYVVSKVDILITGVSSKHWGIALCNPLSILVFRHDSLQKCYAGNWRLKHLVI